MQMKITTPSDTFIATMTFAALAELFGVTVADVQRAYNRPLRVLNATCGAGDCSAIFLPG
jgi:hypothetical protein